MPGVKAILTADELPPPADSINDNGTAILANQKGTAGLRWSRCSKGIRSSPWPQSTSLLPPRPSRDQLDLGFIAVCRRSAGASWRPRGPNARAEGNVSGYEALRLPSKPGRLPVRRRPTLRSLRTEADFAEAKEGRLPMGKATDEWKVGDVDAGFRSAALILDETFVTPSTSHQCMETRTAMAYWQNGKVYVHSGAQSTPNRSCHRAMVGHRSRECSFHQ